MNSAHVRIGCGGVPAPLPGRDRAPADRGLPAAARPRPVRHARCGSRCAAGRREPRAGVAGRAGGAGAGAEVLEALGATAAADRHRAAAADRNGRAAGQAAVAVVGGSLSPGLRQRAGSIEMPVQHEKANSCSTSLSTAVRRRALRATTAGRPGAGRRAGRAACA